MYSWYVIDNLSSLSLDKANDLLKYSPEPVDNKEFPSVRATIFGNVLDAILKLDLIGDQISAVFEVNDDRPNRD